LEEFGRLLKKLQMRGRRDRGDRSVLKPYVRISEEPRTKQMDFFSSLLPIDFADEMTQFRQD